MDLAQLAERVEQLPSSERTQLEALASYWWQLAEALGASNRGLNWNQSLVRLAPQLSERAAAVGAPELLTMLGYGRYASLPAWSWDELLESYAAEPRIQAALVGLAAVYRDIENNTTLLRSFVGDQAFRAWGRERARRDERSRRDNRPPPGSSPSSSSGLAPLALLAGAGYLLARGSSSKGGMLLPLGLAAGAVAMLNQGGSGAEREPRRATPAGTTLPTPRRYAEGKRAQLLARWRGGSEANPRGLGYWLNEYVPRVEAFARIPPVAFLGFTAIAVSQTEVTSASEWGFFQTPARSYERLASSELVRELLGRAADPAQWRARVDEQTAVGLADLLAHYRAVRSQGFEATDGTVWACALAFAGFSAGTGGVVNAWGPFREQLERTDERNRFEQLAGWIVEAARARALTPPSAHPNPAYTWLRTGQKLACGLAVAAELERASAQSAGSPWFPTFPEDLQVNIAIAARGLVPPGEVTTT